MTTIYPLTHLTVITLQGQASRDVLQGQLSCDIREVTASQMRQGALCNLKGRVMALIDVLELNGEIQLIVPKALSALVIKSLRTPAMLSRVTLNESDTFELFGCWPMPSTRYAVSPHPQGYCYGLSPDLSILLVKTQEIHQLQATGNVHEWHLHCLNAGLLSIYPETSGLFLPHRLDLHKTGQLHFNKGCYKGQEIIARMHYKATLKHGVKQFTLHSAEPVHPGLIMLTAGTSHEVGELIDVCALADNHYRITASILFDHPQQIQFQGHQHPCTLS